MTHLLCATSVQGTAHEVGEGVDAQRNGRGENNRMLGSQLSQYGACYTRLRTHI